MSKKQMIYYYISMVILVSAIAVVVVAGFLALMPVEVIKPNVQPYKVITKEVKQGGTLIYEVDSCKFKSVPARIVTRFVDKDGTRYPQPTEDSNVVVGCGKTRTTLAVPFNMPEGEWYLDLEVAYKVNPLRTEYYNFKTDEFVIIKAE